LEYKNSVLVLVSRDEKKRNVSLDFILWYDGGIGM